MLLESCDIENVLIDLHTFFANNPQYKLPPRYLWVIAKILQGQLDKFSTDSCAGADAQ